MIVAVALSTGTVICGLASSSMAARQVDADLAASTIDSLSVAAASGVEVRQGETLFPQSADSVVDAIDLVVASGRRLDLSGTVNVSISRGGIVSLPEGGAAVAGITSGYPRAAQAELTDGTAWMLDSEFPVAFVGTGIATDLGIPTTADLAGYQIDINGTRYDVVGFLAKGTPDLSNVIGIPYHRALGWLGSDDKAQMLVRTEVGGGTAVARVIRVALRPDSPEVLAASQVANVADLRTGVSNQLGRLVGWIGALLFALTILLISNSMIVSVISRTTEIGLRRALGASRVEVTLLFLAEGATTGAVGGLAGSGLSAVVVVFVASASHWTFLLNGLLVALGPVMGAVAGVGASLYPAVRAGGIEPALAVRAD